MVQIIDYLKIYPMGIILTHWILFSINIFVCIRGDFMGYNESKHDDCNLKEEQHTDLDNNVTIYKHIILMYGITSIITLLILS